MWILLKAPNYQHLFTHTINVSRTDRSGTDFQNADHGADRKHFSEDCGRQLCDPRMMKGYLTVFLSLSLSILSGVILTLTTLAIRNGQRLRMECIADVSMNSTLAEFEKTLHDRYGILYVDLSYQEAQPSLQNMERRLQYYLSENIALFQNRDLWGNLALKQVVISDVRTAADDQGGSMKSQAVQYVEDCGIRREETEMLLSSDNVLHRGQGDTMGTWSALMEVIAGMELPVIQNEQGEWEEVPLSNPADRVYGLSGSDVLFLVGAPTDCIPVGKIRKENYLSGRDSSDRMAEQNKAADTGQFIAYLFEMMGNYRSGKEDGLLKYQLEYIAKGKESDYENLQTVVEELVRIRFAVNTEAAFADGGMVSEAMELAQELQAVSLKPAFLQPVAESMLYACAYLEALSEVKTLLEGGRVSFQMESLVIRPSMISEAEIQGGQSISFGISYEQYLACMIYELPEKVRNYRAMDIMEMDIRLLTGNTGFVMDCCVERFRAQIQAAGSVRGNYLIDRTYGYY